MKVEEFVNSYSAEYMLVFHNTKTDVKISDRISSFFFEPRYKVNKLKFTML